jgi:hypothetical protein
VNGARDEVVDHVANDLNVPIEGEEPKPTGRQRDRFSHDRHLFHALLNLTYGFMMFEQVYRYDESDKRFHLPSSHPACPGRSLRSRSPAMADSSTSANTPLER